ncbi:hypothetical protein OX90_11255 [Pseudomonas coronafaciens pv. porri]|uniref:Uncharacterized protein n=2 Tax=Pseudomonas TaxID=286 RepID=A0ABR5JPL4_9PSED|nr:hypothetical protein OX90_11255 [Pseudomonas coronafaciens pv. porri]
MQFDSKCLVWGCVAEVSNDEGAIFKAVEYDNLKSVEVIEYIDRVRIPNLEFSKLLNSYLAKGTTVFRERHKAFFNIYQKNENNMWFFREKKRLLVVLKFSDGSVSKRFKLTGNVFIKDYQGRVKFRNCSVDSKIKSNRANDSHSTVIQEIKYSYKK